VHPPSELLFRAELRSQKRAQNLFGNTDAHDPGADAQHVYVVVLHALVSRVRVVAQRSTDTWYLVCGDACADTRSTYHNASIGGTASYCLTHQTSDIREVYRLGRVCAKVFNLMAQGTQEVNHRTLERKASMIATNGKLHFSLLYNSWDCVTPNRR
jgi:hypothetical protein